MKRNLLIFGASSYIAQHLIAKCTDYTIITVGRNKNHIFDYYLDFGDIKSISDFKLNSNIKVDVVIFAQGANPKNNLDVIEYVDFINMFNLNIFGPALILKNILKNLNKDASCLFFTSVASRKGSYDPSYSSAKAAISGLIASLVRAYPNIRFNSISLGLVEDSPVFKSMSHDFRQKHSNNMFNNKFINPDNVTSMIFELINNDNINNSNISIDGGFII